MNKILKFTMGASAAAMLLLGVSCDKSSDSSKPEFLTKAQTDTLVGGMGEFAGYDINQKIQRSIESDSNFVKTFNRDALLKGFRYAMDADTSMWFMVGMQIAMQQQNQMMQWSQMGLDVDRALYVEQFIKAVKADSVPSQEQLMQLQMKVNQLSDSLRSAKNAYDKAQRENSPEAKANLEAGKKYLADVRAKDKDVKVTESGIGYKITAPGEGEKVSKKDRVVVKSKGTAIKGNSPQQFPEQPIPVAQLPDGVQQAVMMLAKGGQGTFYIPGPLAFGTELANMLGIEPNVMMVYEIEVVDIPSATPVNQ